MIADDLTPNAIKLRDLVLPRLGQFSADALATVVDLAESNLERFAILLANEFSADDANALLKAASYVHLGRFDMCARAACARVIGPKSFVVAKGAALFCSTGCAATRHATPASTEVH